MKFTIQKIKVESSKWLLISATVLGIGLTSCEKEEIAQNTSITSLDAKNAQGEKIYDTQSENQRIFGKALLEAMKNSPALRKFIKTEALKKFNHDYDVLFATVKNEVIEEGKTFRDIMLENIKSEEILKQIEFTNPLLTIFVPSLPENSFSAQTWDTENQIPDVALRLHTTNDVPCFSLDKGEYVIEAPYIPSYPIVVVKQNERVTSSLTKGYELSHVERPFNVVNGVEYKYMDKAFDNRKILTRNVLVTPSGGQIDAKIINAYNIYKNTNGWQRDYIYYGIEPNNPNGEFDNDFQEKITQFRLNENNGSGESVLNRISDQTGSNLGDPKLKNSVFGGYGLQASFWTDGGFEFYLSILMNSKTLGAWIPKRFPADPEQLFYIDYNKVTFPPGIVYFHPKKIQTSDFFFPNLELMKWDIDEYATNILIEIEEEDRTELIDREIMKSSEYAANFGLDFDNIYKKLGLKFGISAKTSRTDKLSISYTQGADPLSNVIVNFTDDVIVRGQPDRFGNIYFTKQYSSNYFTISLEPIRVEGN